MVRARSSTMALRWPTMRLKSVDLPTLGRPTMATTGRPATGASRSSLPGRRRVRRLGTSGGAERRAAVGRLGHGGDGRVRQLGGLWTASRRCRPARRCARPRPPGPRWAWTCRRSRRRACVRRRPRRLRGRAACSICMAGLPTMPTSRVSSLVLALLRPPTTTTRSTSLGEVGGVLLASDGDRADGVDDLELVGARGEVAGQLLELPGRLRRLRQQRHALAAWDLVPVLFLVHEDGVRGEAEQAHDLGVVRACRAGRRCSPPRRAWPAPSAPGSPSCRCHR